MSLRSLAALAVLATACPSSTPGPKPLPDGTSPPSADRNQAKPSADAADVTPPIQNTQVLRHLRAGLVGEDVNDTRQIMNIELNLMSDGRLELVDKNETPPQRFDLVTDWPSITMTLDEWGEAALVDLDGDTALDLVIGVKGPQGTPGELRVYLDATSQPRQAASHNTRIVGADPANAIGATLAHAPEGSLYVKVGADMGQATHISRDSYDVAAATLAPYQPPIPFDWGSLLTVE